MSASLLIIPSVAVIADIGGGLRKNSAVIPGVLGARSFIEE